MFEEADLSVHIDNVEQSYHLLFFIKNFGQNFIFNFFWKKMKIWILSILGFLCLFSLCWTNNKLVLDRNCDKNDLLNTFHNQEDTLISKIEKQIFSKNFSIEIQ